jgi:predicted acylesterase/phospholipase RssA
VFAPVKVADDYYGDGTMLQLAPFSPALDLGARRILVVAAGKRRIDETAARKRATSRRWRRSRATCSTAALSMRWRRISSSCNASTTP